MKGIVIMGLFKFLNVYEKTDFLTFPSHIHLLHLL